MKRIVTFLLSLFIICTCLSGCKKEEPIVYEYDIYDYLDIDISGGNGYGVLSIKPDTFTSSDFKSDEVYIEIKDLVNNVSKAMYATKTTNLTNGDVVEIGINESFVYSGKLNINLSPKLIEIKGLSNPIEIDIFSPDSVVFYGLKGTQEVYYYFPSNSKLPKELAENITYNITVDDDEVEEKRSVLTINTELSETLQSKNYLYSSVYTYLIVNGYLGNEEGKTTLKKVVNDDEIMKAGSERVSKSLSEEIQNKVILSDEYKFEKMVSLYSIDDSPFYYYAVALYTKEGVEMYARFKIKAVWINNGIQILELYKDGTAKKDDIYKGCSLIYKFDNGELEYEPVDVETDSPNN